ncbi:hypothetical protein P170DRAFT_457902 [Aspergillus steynii IBT 23096]|uniref:Uncharacterized protein n=1 Tax=Aspergillus steynii IBT 23096 TaxID=1392250 RepID=A0A2I2FY93_9EURO|nr:uncharacterized protein P170DRAFT_457902 [Aspergillus steynii IBT 23096]PLB45588.1 hypothetical protein P170DRAFT_457902 [Aspergillus steynii IBT 23096]
MAPIRRYLRISKYTILECRIYLDNPSDTRWLLDSRDPVLPRIFAAIRPLVLPKLREENERLFARKKGHPVKDVIAEDEFEVALFLRESRTRHSLLTRHKEFEDQGHGTGVGRNKGKNPEAGTQADTGILVESESEDESGLRNIPQAGTDEDEDGGETSGKRRRATAGSSGDDVRVSKRQKDQDWGDDDGEDKKMRFRTNYEGFNIYGWTLCLLVTRKGGRARPAATPSEPSRQALMEEWMSTQQGDVDEE